MNELIAQIDPLAALERVQGVVKDTPLVPFEVGMPELELRLKLECFQETGSFKVRGAWNNVAQLSPEERAAGVVATSSGNHGSGLAWAAQRAGVKATIFMPKDAYPNKVQRCRDHGAEVVLTETRAEAEAACAERVAAGAVLIHPYDREGTIEGAGTVGVEVARNWPDVEVLIAPVGGGGLMAGCALAMQRTLDPAPLVVAVEPTGAATLTAGLGAGRPVALEDMTSAVQGLCPLNSGALNIAVARKLFVQVERVSDAAIFAAQARLVRAGYTVEPAGAATLAFVLSDGFSRLLEGRSEKRPLRVAAIVSGGNPDPAQLEAIRATK